MPPRLSRLALPAALALCAAAGTSQAQEELPLTPPPATVWEGAFGLSASYRPEYAGAAKQIFKVSPALFLRYGRFTITNASGFVTRRADDVVRGLGMDMVRNEQLRLNLALRFDAGRGENTSDALKGLGNIKPTIRARLQASWKLQGPWRAGASWSLDAIHRGGGNFGDVSGGWEQRIAPDTVVSVGSSLSVGAQRYMQSYFGITEEQASRTTYPVFKPGAGVRDVTAYTNLRHDIGSEWIVLGGASTSRLLGQAAASPLTGRKTSWGINVGLARRF